MPAKYGNVRAVDSVSARVSVFHSVSVREPVLWKSKPFVVRDGAEICAHGDFRKVYVTQSETQNMQALFESHLAHVDVTPFRAGDRECAFYCLYSLKLHSLPPCARQTYESYISEYRTYISTMQTLLQFWCQPYSRRFPNSKTHYN